MSEKDYTFEEEIAIEHFERVNGWKWKTYLKGLRGEYIYTDFCVWLNCQGIPEYRNNQNAFAKWLKENNISLTEYQRRWIAEKYFGWKFTWNEEKKEWESKKI